jgi:hypothetical protein
MAVDLTKEKGISLEQQFLNWRELSPIPFSKLNDDAFTRVRVILMNGVENEAWAFQHHLARMNRELREPLARVRRAEQHQQTMVNWMLPADQSVLETTIGYEQVAVEVTASVASHEPDPRLRDVYHFGLLEDFDHLYRFTALLDRLEGKDANNLLQSYTDLRPGRATMIEHRSPLDDVRKSYDCRTAAPITKLNALTVLAAEQQTRNYYATVGPLYADPLARSLYAEISSVEEQHVTQYESLQDPDETWMERWLLHEATEAYNYLGCMEQEDNSAIKKIWERMLAFELGHLHFAIEHFRRLEPKRDPFEILPAELPERIGFESHRNYVRRVIENEMDRSAIGTEIVQAPLPADSPTLVYRQHVNAQGSPSEMVAAGYRWRPGTELAATPAPMTH